MKKGIMILLIIIILAALAFFVYKQYASNVSQNNTTNPNPNAQIHQVMITESAFSPQELTINKDDRVTWTNQHSEAGWPASAVHPSHTVYPSSSINKCETSEQSTIFDACTGLNQGESFTFNEQGTWAYHDHLNPSKFGRIIVQ